MMAKSMPPKEPLPKAEARAAGKEDSAADLVQWTGLLPRQPARFLGRLSREERRDVFAILGKFQEVRGLVGAGRLLHAYLKEAPHAAARGQISFSEFLAEKSGLLSLIYALRRRLNRAAWNIGLILPPVSAGTEGGRP